MSKTYIPVAVRRAVIERARDRCEYCSMFQSFSFTTFHIDHIIPEKQLGETELENLALACSYCNLAKGETVSYREVETGDLYELFNPRIHEWSAHFKLLPDGRISPLTVIGTGTCLLLKINVLPRRQQRRELYEILL